MSDLLLAFYGDDFTGSTDAMDVLSRAGIRTVLFLEPPTPERLSEEFNDAQAIGIAGTSRSMTPAEMDEELPGQFDALGSLDAPIVHYKVCSTFDSSPAVGSIGRAIDIGQTTFDSPLVPVVVGAPQLGRYVAFANLFAEYEGESYRIDRHPTMSEHPITPMDEGDLRRHLGKQTEKSIRSVNVVDLREEWSEVDLQIRDLAESDSEVVVIDGIDDDDLRRAGRIAWDRAAAPGRDSPLFTVGSSGLEYALVKYWDETGTVERRASHESPPTVESMIVVSGSASPVTKSQIEWALDGGFDGVRLDTERLIDPATAPEARQEAIDRAKSSIETGNSVVVYTALGPDDPAIERTRRMAESVDQGAESQDVGRTVATEQGHILRELLKETEVTRVCVAGGDTCGHVVPNLNIHALEVQTPIDPGAPLCRTNSDTSEFDGLHVALKGGQLGKPEYFEKIRRGHSSLT